MREPEQIEKLEALRNLVEALFQDGTPIENMVIEDILVPKPSIYGLNRKRTLTLSWWEPEKKMSRA